MSAVFEMLALAGLAAGVTLPGAVIVWRVLGCTRPARTTAWFVGPAVGLALTGAALVGASCVGVAGGVVLVVVMTSLAGAAALIRPGCGVILRLPHIGRADALAATVAGVATAVYVGAAFLRVDAANLAAAAVDFAPPMVTDLADNSASAMNSRVVMIALAMLVAMGVTPFFYWMGRASGASPPTALVLLGVVLWLYAQPGAVSPGPLDGPAAWSLVGDVLGLTALLLVSLSINVGDWRPRLASAALLALTSLVSPTNAVVVGPAVGMMVLVRALQQRRHAAGFQGVAALIIALLPVLAWESQVLRVLDYGTWLSMVVAGAALLVTATVRDGGWLSHEGAAPVALVISVLTAEVATWSGSLSDELLGLRLLVVGAVAVLAASTAALPRARTPVAVGAVAVHRALYRRRERSR